MGSMPELQSVEQVLFCDSHMLSDNYKWFIVFNIPFSFFIVMDYVDAQIITLLIFILFTMWHSMTLSPWVKYSAPHLNPRFCYVTCLAMLCWQICRSRVLKGTCTLAGAHLYLNCHCENMIDTSCKAKSPDLSQLKGQLLGDSIPHVSYMRRPSQEECTDYNYTISVVFTKWTHSHNHCPDKKWEP